MSLPCRVGELCVCQMVVREKAHSAGAVIHYPIGSFLRFFSPTSLLTDFFTTLYLCLRCSTACLLLFVPIGTPKTVSLSLSQSYEEDRHWNIESKTPRKETETKMQWRREKGRALTEQKGNQCPIRLSVCESIYKCIFCCFLVFVFLLIFLLFSFFQIFYCLPFSLFSSFLLQFILFFFLIPSLSNYTKNYITSSVHCQFPLQDW